MSLTIFGIGRYISKNCSRIEETFRMKFYLCKVEIVEDMKRYLKILLVVSLVCGVLMSCSTTRRSHSHRPNYTLLSKQYGFRINSSDFIPLYEEGALWLGTPYRYGGNSKRGVDCSGFVSAVYRKLFHVKLNRSAELILRRDCKKIGKKKLQTCDLVFFATGRNRSKVNHVGIYLKNGYFIHASTSKGVVLSHLVEPYYRSKWKTAARDKM